MQRSELNEGTPQAFTLFKSGPTHRKRGFPAATAAVKPPKSMQVISLRGHHPRTTSDGSY
jgi:hypothetical protein